MILSALIPVVHLEYGSRSEENIAINDMKRMILMTTIYLAGDSTVTDQEHKPFAGWGQMMQPFFKAGATISNHAHSGCSTKSFVVQKRLKKILEVIKEGDYLLIQFGHNDEKNNEWYTEPFTTFTEGLKVYIEATREKTAYPVLVTPAFRRLFSERGILYDTHHDYAKAVRKLAIEEHVPLIDLHKRSGDLLESLGAEKSKDIFLHIEPGIYEQHPDGIEDDTHFSEFGAREMAKLVIAEIRDHVPELIEFLK